MSNKTYKRRVWSIGETVISGLLLVAIAAWGSSMYVSQKREAEQSLQQQTMQLNLERQESRQEQLIIKQNNNEKEFYRQIYELGKNDAIIYEKLDHISRDVKSLVDNDRYIKKILNVASNSKAEVL